MLGFFTQTVENELDIILGLVTIGGVLIFFFGLYWGVMLDKSGYWAAITGIAIVLGGMILERKLILKRKI